MVGSAILVRQKRFGACGFKVDMESGWTNYLQSGLPSVTPLLCNYACIHYSDIIMGVMASQITRFTIVYSTFFSGTDQKKHQSSTSLAFVQGIHKSLVNSPHKWPVTWKMFPFDDVIMKCM